MDKQTTIAFVLIGAILIIWLYMNSPEPTPQQQPAQDSTIVSKDTVRINQTEKPAVRETLPEDTSSVGKLFSATQDVKERVITVENELVKLELTSNGAKVKRYFLKQYQTWYANEDSNDFYRNHVQLVNTTRDNGDLNIVFMTKDGKLLNTSSAFFTPDANKAYYKIGEKDSLSISFRLILEGDRSIEKNYLFKGKDYSFRCDVVLNNMNEVISNYRYDLVWTSGINFVENNSADEANYSNASFYAGGEQTIIDASGDEKVTKDVNGKVEWLGVRNKYFAVIMAPLNLGNEGGAYIDGTRRNVKAGVREYYNTSIKVPLVNSNIQKNSFLVYMGPVDYDILKSYNRSFEAIVDFGSLFGLKVIIRPISEYILLPLFKLLHLFIPNYGWVIIVFSLIIKVVLYPLTRSSLRSMKKMQLLQPKIAELKEKFKDDPQKMNKETMKLYSTYGINPAGGCLPILLQMPILVALWGLFNVAIELRQQPFALWIRNLSSPDVIYTLPFKIPLFGIDQISGLAVLLGVTMYYQQKMSVKDPNQKALIYMMPVLFTLMFMGFPAGLNLYYFMFNLFSIAQQYYVNHRHTDIKLEPVKNQKKSGGFMARMMEAAEKSAQTQQAAKKKKK